MADKLLLNRMQALATARGEGMGFRLALAIVVAGASLIAVNPAVTALWIAAVAISQFADHRIYRRFRNRHDARRVRRREVQICAASTFVCAAIYMLLPAVAYFSPVPEAKVFSLLLICGILLGVVIQQSPVRAIFFAGMAPMAAALLLPPAYQLVAPGNFFADLAVFVMALSFALHIAIGFKVYHRAMKDLLVARDAAIERGRAAEQANRSKSRFLALMSHELRTPMNGVLGAGHLLRRTDLTDRQQELVDALEDAGEVLMVILNDILDLAKLDAARLSLDRASADVEDLSRSLANLWRSRAEEKGLTLALDCEIDEGAQWAMLDAIRVRQILGNLLSNAVKFTDAGSITLQVRATRAGDRVKLAFSIRDTGDGITPETLATLFRPFSQGDDSSERRHGGTGLGLMICRKLAELMGGDVEVESTPGQGSCFCLAFEAEAGEPEETGKDAAAPAAKGPPISILIAEDNAINRLVVSGLLETGGHDLTFAEDGQEAIEAAAARPFDLILMDLHMPRADGLTATRAIRESGGPNAGVFICGLSADAGRDNIREAIGRGMNAYITKPIAPAELERVVGRARTHAANRSRQNVAMPVRQTAAAG